jgi:hypothetical protein
MDIIIEDLSSNNILKVGIGYCWVLVYVVTVVIGLMVYPPTMANQQSNKVQRTDTADFMLFIGCWKNFLAPTP